MRGHLQNRLVTSVHAYVYEITRSMQSRSQRYCSTRMMAFACMQRHPPRVMILERFRKPVFCGIPVAFPRFFLMVVVCKNRVPVALSPGSYKHIAEERTGERALKALAQACLRNLSFLWGRDCDRCPIELRFSRFLHTVKLRETSMVQKISPESSLGVAPVCWIC